MSFSEFSDWKLISTITAANCAPPEIFYVNTAQHVFMGELALHSKLENVIVNFFCQNKSDNKFIKYSCQTTIHSEIKQK